MKNLKTNVVVLVLLCVFGVCSANGATDVKEYEDKMIDVLLPDNRIRQVNIKIGFYVNRTYIVTSDADGIVDEKSIHGACEVSSINDRSDEFVCEARFRTYYVKLLREDLI